MKKFARVLALVLALATMLSMTAFAAEKKTTWIELTLEDDEYNAETGEPYRVKISAQSSRYLTNKTKLLPEVVSLIYQMYDPMDNTTPMWQFDCWEMKQIMDDGLMAYMEGINEWSAYLDLHYEDVAHAHGDITLKDLLKSKESTLGDIVTNVPHKITFKNEVETSKKYGVTYTMTVVRHVESMPELDFNSYHHAAYISGYPDGTVRPEATITRAEVATIFYRNLTEKSKEEFRSDAQLFTDVSEGDWYYEAVNTLAAAGIIKGNEDGTFRPNAPITRAEIAAMAVRFTERGRNLEGAAIRGVFADVKAGTWYAAIVELANELGWVNGYNGLYRPMDNMTRAEVMAMVNRILQRAVKPENMHGGMHQWPDNDPDAWYYADVQEATNSHIYKRIHEDVQGRNFEYEQWLAMERD